MKYGLDGQMMIATQAEPSATDQAQPDMAAEQMEILATEIELLTAELEEEKSAAKVQKRECEKHLHTLRSTEVELSSCQEALSTAEQEVKRVHVEMKEKFDKLETVEGKLLGRQQNAEQIAGASVQMQTQGKIKF
jgi:predicted nuclease with TOPRIM domain